ncbi:MAG: hypothetical protein ACJ76P_12645 [Actinomycetota bacterium]
MEPRLFGIPALREPVVAVLRRGPSDWFHLGAWDLPGPSYRAGSWLRGTVYPQRCDVSPDGRWFCYFALKASAEWELGSTYVAISRMPWLSALAAGGTQGTWTHGLHFVDDAAVWEPSDREVGDVAKLRERFGMEITHGDSFAVDRRRGWEETDDTPPRDPSDVWDERCNVAMEKDNGSGRTLRVSGSYAAFRSSWNHRSEAVYELDGTNLDGVQWADWSPDRNLLVATVDGRLQVRASDGDAVEWEHDLSTLEPDPAPPPGEASAW